jgi:tetratricopeptide (TPR) repeat protein
MLDSWGQIEEGVRYQRLGMLDEALVLYRGAADQASDPAVIGTALCREAHLYRAWCRWEEGIAAARRSASIALAHRLDELYAEALNAEAIVHQERGAYDDALTLYQIIVRMNVGDRLLGIAFQNMGSIAAQRADLVTADRYYRDSIRCFSRAGYRWGEAFALTNRAALALDGGRAKEGEVIGRQAVVAAKKVGDLEVLGMALMNVAEAIAAQGKAEDAEALVLEARRYFQMEENALRQAQCNRYLANVKLLQGDRAEAARLYSLALELATHVGAEAEISRIRESIEKLGNAA